MRGSSCTHRSTLPDIKLWNISIKLASFQFVVVFRCGQKSNWSLPVFILYNNNNWNDQLLISLNGQTEFYDDSPFYDFNTLPKNRTQTFLMTWSLWCLPSADTHSCLQTANSRKRGPAAPLILHLTSSMSDTWSTIELQTRRSYRSNILRKSPLP